MHFYSVKLPDMERFSSSGGLTEECTDLSQNMLNLRASPSVLVRNRGLSPSSSHRTSRVSAGEGGDDGVGWRLRALRGLTNRLSKTSYGRTELKAKARDHLFCFCLFVCGDY